MFDDKVLMQEMEQATKSTQKAETQRQEAAEKMQSLYKSLSDEGFRIEDQDKIAVDLETANLSQMKEANAAMEQNLVRLINLLDESTNGILTDFSSMQSATLSEKIVGFFSESKAKELRQERISKSSVMDNLNNLLEKSNGITAILSAELADVEEKLDTARRNLTEITDRRSQLLEEKTKVSAELDDVSQELVRLTEQKESVETAEERSKLDIVIQEQSIKYKDLQDRETVLLSQSQTLERFRTLNSASVSALEDQRTAHKTMINKLKTDTEQRYHNYQQLETSMKTAESQREAHKLNQVGEELDKFAAELQTSIAASAKNSLMDMMENQKGRMADANELMRRKTVYDEEYNRRFGQVTKDHDSANYQ